MTRVKTFDSTGIATSGRLYAGDLNLIQDQYADLTNLAQTVSLSTLKIGETGLQLLRYGAGEARITGLLRTDGILRGLGGLYPGAFTTAQRNAIPAGFRPYGLIILNTDANRFEWNRNTDASPAWFGLDSPAADALIAHTVASPAHAASAISYAGGPGLSATNVESAIDELAVEKLDVTAIPGAWTSFTPVLFGSSGNPTYGTGGVAGRYMKIGRTVWFKMIFRWVGGSSGSGFYTVQVPVATPLEWEVASNAKVNVGNWNITFNDASMALGDITLRDSDEFFLFFPTGPGWPSAGSNLGAPAAVPQSITLNGVYETTS